MIKSLLDTDLYKFSVMQFAYHRFPNDFVNYEFTCRNKDVKLGFLKEKLENELIKLCCLKLTKEELNYLSKIKNGLFSKDFIIFLENFKLKKECISIKCVNEDLIIKISGRWVDTVLFEIPVLSLVNELYFKQIEPNPNYLLGKFILIKEIEKIRSTNLQFCEFGTRRRFSASWQREVVKTLKEQCPKNLIGTSNLLLAKEFNLEPIGTHPHECLAFYQGKFDYFEFQARFLNDWYSEFGNKLAVALTDIYTTDIFLNEFNQLLTEKYNGLRQDSGDPLVWFSKVQKHYQLMNIDLKNKTIVFSDSLNFDKALAIFEKTAGKAKVSFGIGTFLTNNLGPKALNIVIKMVKVNKKEVVKISDEPHKAIGSSLIISQIKEKFKI